MGRSRMLTAALAGSVLLAGMAGLAGAGGASAASFPCNRARAPDERAICADRGLNDRDVELSVRYELLLRLVAMGQRGDQQDRQRGWLTARHGCGADRACLRASYDERLAELRKAFDGVASGGPY